LWPSLGFLGLAIAHMIVALGLLLAGAFAYQRFLPKEEGEELGEEADERQPQAYL
jgi:hypothetical protein